MNIRGSFSTLATTPGTEGWEGVNIRGSRGHNHRACDFIGCNLGACLPHKAMPHLAPAGRLWQARHAWACRMCPWACRVCPWACCACPWACRVCLSLGLSCVSVLGLVMCALGLVVCVLGLVVCVCPWACRVCVSLGLSCVSLGRAASPVPQALPPPPRQCAACLPYLTPQVRSSKLLFYARLAEKALQSYERDGWSEFPTRISHDRREVRPGAARGHQRTTAATTKPAWGGAQRRTWGCPQKPKGWQPQCGPIPPCVPPQSMHARTNRQAGHNTSTAGAQVRPTADRGPILLCVDTSGSMRGARETVAKALALECMRAAREQERDCYVFAFSGPSEVRGRGAWVWGSVCVHTCVGVLLCGQCAWGK